LGNFRSVIGGGATREIEEFTLPGQIKAFGPLISHLLAQPIRVLLVFDVGIDLVKSFEFSKAPLVNLIPLTPNDRRGIHFSWTMDFAIIAAKAGIDSLYQRIGVFNFPFKKSPCHTDSASGVSCLKSQFFPDGTDPMGSPKD